MRLALLPVLLLLAGSAEAAVPRGQPSPAPAPSGAPAEWTLFFYLGADCDLEADELNDLREMLAVGSSPAVQLVALVDRAEDDGEDEEDSGYSGEGVANLGNWTSARLLHIEKGRLRTLADWGEVNLADPKVLARFLREGQQRYPARRYGLVFMDHGLGWSGVMADDSADDEDDVLSLAEIQEALGPAAERSGPLELLSFDACLMGSFEAARALAPFARYMVASEELAPYTGWDYRRLLRALQAHPEWDGAAVGRETAEGFRAFLLASDDEDTRNEMAGSTVSVVDLQAVPALASAVTALGQAGARELRAGGRKAWLAVAAARSGLEEYGNDPASSDESGEEEVPAGLVDLRQLARALGGRAAGADVRRTAAEVEAALDRAVVHNLRGQAKPQASGLSIYFPADAASFDDDAQESYAEVADARWLAFLKAYTSEASRDRSAPRLAGTRLAGAGPAGGSALTLSGDVQDDDVSEAHLVLARRLGEDTVEIGRRPLRPGVEVAALHAEWNARWLSLAAGGRRVPWPVETEPGSAGAQAAVTLPAQWRRGSGDWTALALHFRLERGRGELLYAFRDSDVGPVEIQLRPGDRLRPVQAHVDGGGGRRLLPSADPAEVLTVPASGGLGLAEEPVAPGRYRLGLAVRDFAGNESTDWVEVELR